MDYDAEGNTPLHLAVIAGNTSELAALLGSNPDLKIKEIYDMNGKTPFDLANENGNAEIIKLLTGYILPPGTALWKGPKEDDIQLMDNILNFELSGAKPVSNDWSICPICLKVSNRDSGCKYMSHNCSLSPDYYNKELYNKYKNERGMIDWCTICNRICHSGPHGHYNISYSKGSIATLLPGDHDPFALTCKSAGGGDLEEKVQRVRRLREFMGQLQSQIGKISYNDAMSQLSEEFWNAPLIKETTKIQKIVANKKWNISSSNFKRSNNANNGPPTNIDFKGVVPTAGLTGTNMMSTDYGTDLIQFHHKKADGTPYDHEDGLISKDGLEVFIQSQISSYGEPTFAVCFGKHLGCASYVYPQEVQPFIDPALYKIYRPAFNQAFKGKLGGSRKQRRANSNSFQSSNSHEPVFKELTDATCSIPQNTSGGRSKRTTRKKNKHNRK